MWDPKHNIMGTKKENWMERTCIENGRRSTSKESTRRNPWREEKPRSTDEKMERRTGINKPSAYMKRRRLIKITLFSKFINHYLSNVDALCNTVTCSYVQWIPNRHLTITNTWSSMAKKKSKGFHRLCLSTFNFLRMNNTTALHAEHVKCECL